jgi:hypothetical protein
MGRIREVKQAFFKKETGWGAPYCDFIKEN